MQLLIVYRKDKKTYFKTYKSKILNLKNLNDKNSYGQEIISIQYLRNKKYVSEEKYHSLPMTNSKIIYLIDLFKKFRYKISKKFRTKRYYKKQANYYKQLYDRQEDIKFNNWYYQKWR